MGGQVAAAESKNTAGIVVGGGAEVWSGDIGDGDGIAGAVGWRGTGAWIPVQSSGDVVSGTSTGGCSIFIEQAGELKLISSVEGDGKAVADVRSTSSEVRV